MATIRPLMPKERDDIREAERAPTVSIARVEELIQLLLVEHPLQFHQ
jgi:hypothetical protein